MQRLNPFLPLLASLGLHLSVFGLALLLVATGVGAGNSAGHGTGLEGYGVLRAELVSLPGEALTAHSEETPAVASPAEAPDSPSVLSDSPPHSPNPLEATAKALPVQKAETPLEPKAPPPPVAPKQPAPSPSKRPPAPKPLPEGSDGGAGSGSPVAGTASGAAAHGGMRPGSAEDTREGLWAGNGEVDAKPMVTHRVKVAYPEAARRKKITGQVILRFHVDEQGAISRLAVARAEPEGIFEEAALAAVQKWRFSPATKGGKPVPYWVEMPIQFSLKNQ
jgi:TonB family C-terminal domain